MACYSSGEKCFGNIIETHVESFWVLFTCLGIIQVSLVSLFVCVFFFFLSIRICSLYLVNIAFNLAYTTFVHIKREF